MQPADEIPFAHILDVPHRTDAAARRFFLDEVGSLAAALSSHCGVDTGPAALTEAIGHHNEHVALLRQIGDLRRRERPPLSGADYHALLVASGSAPKAALVPLLREVLAALDDRDGPSPGRARLMLAGSQLDDPGFTAVVESTGALVVADRYCWGSHGSLAPITASSNPIAALADHYLGRTSCPRMMDEHAARVREIVEVAADYAVDGVILQTMKFCDLWGVEAAALTQALRAAGLAVLRLEREYALSNEGQLRTRVQAFLESLGR